MRRALLAVLVAVLAGSGAACGGSESPPPPMEKGGCGMAAYEWLPKEQVGHVVTWRESDRSQFNSMTIDVMLAAAGGSDFFSPVPYGARLFHLRYTTQDRGQQVEATGLVSVPWIDGAERDSYPMVVFLHGTSGFMGECAPSYMLDDGSIFPLVLLSSQGYVVFAPDYIGMDAEADFNQPPPVKHAYLGLEQTAIGSLDIVRAGRELLATQEDLNADADDDLVIWGGSQGGHAAFASDLVAPYYAPELKVRANVALVPPTDLTGIAAYALGSVNEATGAFAAVLTALHFWHQGSESLDTLFTNAAPWNFPTAVPDAMYSGCSAEDRFDGITEVSQVYLQDVIDKGTTGQWDALQPWGCYLQTNSITWTPIARLRDTPTLFVVSQNDTLVYAPAERADFPRLCEQGYQLQYLECAEAGHAEGAIWSLPEQVAWVKDRLAGKPIAAADLCAIKEAVRCQGQPAN
jgi:hypothetical protein